MIRIIHISDLHLESESPSHEKSAIISALSNDLKGIVMENTILVFTGDLIDKGGLNFKNKENIFEAFENFFIEPILVENPKLIGKIFIVPGNHDVFRNKINPVSEEGLKVSLTDSDKLDDFIISDREYSIHLKRLEDYKIWERSFYKKYNNKNVSNFETTFKIQLDNYEVGISCLNSSWLCKDDNDKQKILLGRNQIEHSLSEINDCDIKFALMHHPLEYYQEFDSKIIKTLIYKNYDILFTGHIHELASSYTQDLTGDVFISIANSTIGGNESEGKYTNGYTYLDYHYSDKIVATYKKYLVDHEKFVKNTDIGEDNGEKTFKLLQGGKMAQFSRNLEIIGEIESRYFEKINDDILVEPNHTDANCTIDNLFVEPEILNNPQNNLSKDETKSYSIDTLLSSNESFIIYGRKESGKTLLLDKLLVDSVKKFNKYRSIPVLIKFDEMGKKCIKRIIREFLGIPSKDITSFLEDNAVVLLIDDIKFDEKHIEKIKKIENLISDYSNTRIIAAATQILDSIIPTDYLEHNSILKANLVFIQNFGSKQIKDLIQKWYGDRAIDLQDKMQKLIKSFVDFGLPKTPLSVTLFIWIFEKQEKKPINNSVLVEMFIENLLEKTKLENIYSETFDFTNKKRLLSFVAKYMYDKGDPDLNYSVDYFELLDYFRDYLSSRFLSNPQKVLEDFILRGIFSYQDENLLRFKSAFFFHFFLSLQLDYDPNFKKLVLSDDNYLNFIEEISYYTGLKRDDLEVVSFIQKKLDDAFLDFNNDVVENYEKVDRVLESKKEDTVTFQIDGMRVRKKLTDKQIDEMYDDSLSTIPVRKDIKKKSIENFETKKNIDRVLKIACNVLKNSEDIDDFTLKRKLYENILLSSISFLMQYRDALIFYYLKNNKSPDHFPKNIDFSLVIRILPLMHQVTIFNWLGTQKLCPVIKEKIENDKRTSNISEYEKFLSVFIFSDVRGTNYTDLIKEYVKSINRNYLKDLSFLKILSYYHLRTNDLGTNKMYLETMTEIKQQLGHISKHQKTKFIQRLKESKDKGE